MKVIYTVGHSTRSLEELVELLREAAVTAVADVRRFPASRRYPQHNRDNLAAGLAAAGIRYHWLGERLGGRRKALLPIESSPNAGWETDAFRNYADAMSTPDFLAGIAELENLAAETPTAFLCAERLWWRCHRRLLADLFTARGWTVRHLMEPGKISTHVLPDWALVEGDAVTYPPVQPLLRFPGRPKPTK